LLLKCFLFSEKLFHYALSNSAETDSFFHTLTRVYPLRNKKKKIKIAIVNVLFQMIDVRAA
jgi:hypothetical protein